MAGDHIVAVANFFGPRSGGLRTAMLALGREYRALGYRHSYLVPGAREEVVETDAGTMYTVAAPLLPASGGYRVITRVAAVTELLAALRPDRVELSDRTTLHSLTRWAADRGIGSVVIAHERLDGVCAQAGVPQPIAHRLVDRRNRATAAHASAIVATTAYAAAEFDRIGVPVHRVPLGVDLDRFRPLERPRSERIELVLCSRLSTPKRGDLAIDTLRELRRRGVDAALTIAGHGPQEAALQRRAAGLPVRFVGHIGDPDRLRAVLASADLALAPCPFETFGLAALEAMACGTPVVGHAASALPEVIGQDRMAGRAAAGTAPAFADAVMALLAVPPGLRSAAARRRARRFTWRQSAERMLELPWGVRPDAIAV